MPRTIALTLDEYAGVSGLLIFLYAENDETNAVANAGGDTLTAGSEGAFTATISESLSGIYNTKVKQGSTVIAEGGKAYFDSTTNTVIVDSAFQMYAAQLAAFKADAELGTATGMAAQVLENNKLAKSDEIIEERSGVQVLVTYEHGTDTELLPVKAAKQPGGAALTNPVTQQCAGFRE